MHEVGVWSFIAEKLSDGKKTVLLCVADSKGSSPGRKGFKMAVAGDGMRGSIGGGIMEHKFVELAKEILLSADIRPFAKKQFHNKSAAKNQSGMICSGEQTILLFPLNVDHLNEINKITACLRKRNEGILTLSQDEISFAETISTDAGFDYYSETDWRYSEIIGRKEKIYIIGGGHCSLALSRVMKWLGFSVHVFDNRTGLNTLDENEFADEKKIVDDFSSLSELIPEGDHYVVVMTFGYRTDDISVRALIEHKFAYFGVLGSESKIEKLFSEWRDSGIEEAKLNKIKAPAGVKVNSQTPEEIAVSIAAEIIAVRNSDLTQRVSG